MASVTFDQFLPEILPEASGVPYPVAINAVRNACFDFCRKTLIWNEFQDPENYTLGTAEYQVTPASGAQVVQVMSITLDDGRTLDPASIDETVKVRPTWRTTVGIIEWFVQSAPDTFRFVSVPNSSGTYTAQVAYAPLRSATSIDASIYNLYLEGIKHGALWKLKSMNNQPWTDPQGAAFSGGMFLQAISAAIAERTRSNSRATLRVTPVQFV